MLLDVLCGSPSRGVECFAVQFSKLFRKDDAFFDAIGVVSQPYDRLSRTLIDALHHLDLLGAFATVFLADTQRIDPKYLLVVGLSQSQHAKPKIVAHSNLGSTTVDNMHGEGRIPCVRESGENRRLMDRHILKVNMQLVL